MEFPSLNPEECDRIRTTVQEWALLHPRPETPVLMLMDGSAMTPRNIAAALNRPDTARGTTLYRMFAVALHGNEKLVSYAVEIGRMSLEEILDHFKSDISRWCEDARV